MRTAAITLINALLTGAVLLALANYFDVLSVDAMVIVRSVVGPHTNTELRSSP